MKATGSQGAAGGASRGGSLAELEVIWASYLGVV